MVLWQDVATTGGGEQREVPGPISPQPGQSRSQEWLDLNVETIGSGSDIRQRILAIKKSYGSDYISTWAAVTVTHSIPLCLKY